RGPVRSRLVHAATLEVRVNQPRIAGDRDPPSAARFPGHGWFAWSGNQRLGDPPGSGCGRYFRLAIKSGWRSSFLVETLVPAGRSRGNERQPVAVLLAH